MRITVAFAIASRTIQKSASGVLFHWYYTIQNTVVVPSAFFSEVSEPYMSFEISKKIRTTFDNLGRCLREVVLKLVDCRFQRALATQRIDYFLASSISPQKMFIAPRKPRAPINKGSANENSIEVKIPYKDRREIKAPTGSIKKDKALPIFCDALKTSSASTLVVSLRSSNS
jgi:hypothetical protein